MQKRKLKKGTVSSQIIYTWKDIYSAGLGLKLIRSWSIVKLGQNRESKRFSLLPVVFLTFLVIDFNLRNKLILLIVSAYTKREP